VRIPRGKGWIWYLAGSPELESLSLLLDRLFSMAGINRPLKVTDPAGNRIMGLEARLVKRKFDALVYLANESGRDVDFKIETEIEYHTIRELRSMEYYAAPSGHILNGQVMLFSFIEDPTANTVV